LWSRTGYPFSSFPSESCIILFWGTGMVSIPFSYSHDSCWYCVTGLDRLVGDFNQLFSFLWLNFVLWLYWIFS
jgi:hypothetical protein